MRAITPAVKEPQDLSRDDGKRPDSLTLVPWQSGRSATWDVTVAHTLATSYVSQNALQEGSAAAAASARKTTNRAYSTLSATHMFFLIAEIGRRATLCTVYVPVPTHFSGNSAFQCCVHCQHVHSFRVPIVNIPDIHLLILRPWE